MGTLDSIALTPGSGALATTFTRTTSGFKDQVIRDAQATALTRDAWTVSTTGVASRIAADIGRVRMTMVLLPSATGRVYLRFDGTIPSSTVFDWYLDPGERYEVPEELVPLAVSVIGTTIAGLLNTTMYTAA